MSALRRKILEKKRLEQEQQQNPPVASAAPATDSAAAASLSQAAQAPAPAPVAAALPAAPVQPPASKHGSDDAAQKPSKPFSKGFLAGGSLYPDGSREAAPALWRSSASASGRSKVFSLHTLAEGYEIRGSFHEAGRFLGKEDFEVTRNGFSLRIRVTRGTQLCGPRRLRHALRRDTDIAELHSNYFCDNCMEHRPEPHLAPFGALSRCAEGCDFDLCDACHNSPAVGGRFGQAHTPAHRLVERAQERTWIHEVQRAHPELTIHQIIELAQMHWGQGEDGGDDDAEDEDEQAAGTNMRQQD